jgi:hypothetical protein
MSVICWCRFGRFFFLKFGEPWRLDSAPFFLPEPDDIDGRNLVDGEYHWREDEPVDVEFPAKKIDESGDSSQGKEDGRAYPEARLDFIHLAKINRKFDKMNMNLSEIS